MKTFQVHLRDGRTANVQAETYDVDVDQYIFRGKGHSEAQFFNVADVQGISILPEWQRTNLAPPPESSSDDEFPRTSI